MARPLAVALVCQALAVPAAAQMVPVMPHGWFRHNGGWGGHRYVIALDHEVRHTGTASVRIWSVAADSMSFSTIMQEVDATPFRGKRVRLSAWAKWSNVSGRGGLWMRIDGGQVGALDNMRDRPLMHAGDWTRESVVLDVPIDARLIAFGGLLAGSGTLWVDDFDLQPVPDSVRTTGAPTWREDSMPEREGPLPGPTNLGFEERAAATRKTDDGPRIP